MSLAFVSGLIAFAALLASIAIRDHRAALVARRRLLDDSLGLLDNETWAAGGDGFPSLTGTLDGHAAQLSLIPDTMVMRRLPQLWLSAAIRDPMPGLPGLSVIARHSGNEYYAMGADLEHRLDPPLGLPVDILVRGSTPGAKALCDRLAPTLKRLLADPRIKEVAVNANGVRILRQAGEGKRGEHLLLRQAVFEMAHVAREDAEDLLKEARALAHQRALAVTVRAA